MTLYDAITVARRALALTSGHTPGITVPVTPDEAREAYEVLASFSCELGETS